MAAVGFVGAGLLTFEQSLGVIVGANIGTTITGWIVAIVGFKIKLGYFSLLLVFLGALLMLIAKGPWRDAGRALAGFGLLFLGLEFLKTGMAAADGISSLRELAPDNFAGRLLLVGLGVVVTLITQSSSATVATTLAGLSAGLLSMPQALAMVIGADIGTTGTALLATIGTSRSSRRTGWSHVIYNLLTGIGAFLLLPVYLWAVRRVDPGIVSSNAQIVTVAFHSIFNILGVIVVLPVTRPFARLMYRLVPAGEPSPISSLEPRLVETPAAAIEALR